MEQRPGGRLTMENITCKSISQCWNSMETPGRQGHLVTLSDITYLQNHFRLPDNWWDDFGPSPSADASGMTGICHEIIGTDGLAFSPGITEVT